MRVSSLTAVTVGALAVPGAALAAGRLTPTTIFFDAAPLMKLVMFLLIIATLAAVVVAVRKVLSGPSLSGGSTFLQALRLGGPLIGLLGAAFNALMINIGIANVGDVSYAVLAPGMAEAAFLFLLGLIAGVVAVICNWVVEARIDRTVLRA